MDESKSWCQVGGSLLDPAVGIWTLSSDCSQIRLNEQKSNLRNSCITSILSTMAILFMCPLGNDKEVLEKSLTEIHKMDHFAHPMTKSLLN